MSLSFGGVAALSDVGFTVALGAIHAVIGLNGAGKSSLLNVVSGIYRPDSGQVCLLGSTFRQVPASRLGRFGVARTFQNLALFPGLDVLSNVVLGRVASRRAGFLAQAVGSPRARRERNDSLARAEAVLDFLAFGKLRSDPHDQRQETARFPCSHTTRDVTSPGRVKDAEAEESPHVRHSPTSRRPAT